MSNNTEDLTQRTRALEELYREKIENLSRAIISFEKARKDYNTYFSSSDEGYADLVQRHLNQHTLEFLSSYLKKHNIEPPEPREETIKILGNFWLDGHLMNRVEAFYGNAKEALETAERELKEL